jgi:hypothetical protein
MQSMHRTPTRSASRFQGSGGKSGMLEVSDPGQAWTNGVKPYFTIRKLRSLGPVPPLGRP